MTMEGALIERRRERVEHVNKVGYAHKPIKKKRRKTRIQRYVKPKVPRALQELFVACRDVFKGPGTVPAPCDVNKLCKILDNMKPEDVGLSNRLQKIFNAQDAVKVKGSPIVTSTTVYKCSNFSLCLFFLPATAVIPLHNHPEMTVFSKLLLGTMHIKSYDLVDPVPSHDSMQHSQRRLARLVADKDFTSPCDTSVLYPTTGGNIHEFTAITTCAVLDVLGPPYSKEDGRDGSHYKEVPFCAVSNGENSVKEEEGECYVWLEETEVPENSHMDEIEYLGPQIDDK
ncbi:plant cysteine oxidase 2-like [Mangifera indica]|uniref:plant cysteine oxidase 2-like n=1 Tax=Mangifera indica TaxID=29780 RepID=UPI001CFACE40|nr:plant cysteine oxidase 2-like [Mangifera indica]